MKKPHQPHEVDVQPEEAAQSSECAAKSWSKPSMKIIPLAEKTLTAFNHNFDGSISS